MLNTILMIAKYLPEVISLIKFLEKQVSQGIERREIRRRIDGINNAFDNSSRQQAARDLNDIFRG
jgi:hypothetical protein